MKQLTIWRVTLPIFMWICSCQGSTTSDLTHDQRKASSSAENLELAPKEGKRNRTEIDEVPANMKANLKGYDTFSCVQKNLDTQTSSEIELCFEVSRTNMGNDDTAIQYAQALCGHNQWQVGKSCPKSGVLTSCKGAVMNSGLTYDKYLYKKGLTIDDECMANGGQQIAEIR
jgi:hypothetical protein